MRKRLGSLALLLCFWLLTDLSAIHAQQSDVHRLSLHFDGFSIETEYLEHEVYLVEYDTPLEKGFEIKCNESSETIDRYTLSKSFDTLNYGVDSLVLPISLSSGYYIQEINRDYVLSKFNTTAIFRTTIHLEIYHWNNFRQINRVLNGGLRAVSNGQWTIESPIVSSISTTGIFPTTKVQVQSSGVATIQYGNAIESGYSFSFLDYFGWNVTSSTSTSSYIRKYISNSYTISLYP